jgi:SAM-dependent methyltransferase
MKISSERYFPHINNAILGPFEPYISYEHWHRYCYAKPFVTGKTVLDIASGEGYGSAYLAAHAAQVYGVDVSEEAVQHARGAYPRDNLTFLLGSAGAIPIPGEHCLDAIVSFETIEHLDAATQESFAREAKRLLKPDGVLLISTPNRLVYTEAIDHHNPYHLREFTSDEFRQFLHQHFQHVQTLSQRVYPISYIWDIDRRSPDVAEYQIVLEGDRFRPQETDNKEVRYLISVCSNRAEPVAGLDSILIDLSDVAFRGVPGRGNWHDTSLFLDSGSGFRAEEVVNDKVEYAPRFRVTFPLNPAVDYRQVRWDPLELRICTVRLHRACWRDAAGASHAVDLNQVASNGERGIDGVYHFETVDPMFFLPIGGFVKSVTLEGECSVASEVDSMHRMENLLQRRSEDLYWLKRILEDRERDYRQRQSRAEDKGGTLMNWVRSALASFAGRSSTGRANGGADGSSAERLAG